MSIIHDGTDLQKFMEKIREGNRLVIREGEQHGWNQTRKKRIGEGLRIISELHRWIAKSDCDE